MSLLFRAWAIDHTSQWDLLLVSSATCKERQVVGEGRRKRGWTGIRDVGLVVAEEVVVVGGRRRRRRTNSRSLGTRSKAYLQHRYFAGW